METAPSPKSATSTSAQFPQPLARLRLAVRQGRFRWVNLLTCAALLLAQLTLLPNSAHADITALPVQSGADVVITYSGSVDLTGMTFVGAESISGYVTPSTVQYFSSSGAFSSLYSFVPAPGTAFGPGGPVSPNSVSGQDFGVNFPSSLVYVPSGYVSGSALSGSMTFTGATLSSLGIYGSGTYTSTATPSFRFIVTFGPPPEELSAFATGLPMANAEGQMLISAGSTVTNDLNNHLFYLRAGQGEEAADDSIASAIDDGVVVGQGDGADPIVKRVPRSRRWELFTTVNYGNIKLSAVGSQAGVQIDAWAPSVGIERHLTRSLALGFATTFLTSDQRYTGGLGSLHLEGPALSAYLSFVRKGYWSSLLYSFGSYELDSRRNPGFGFPTANGTTRTYTNSVQYNTGWNFRFQDNTFVTGPFAGIDYLHGSVDAYSETGGGAAALRYGKQSYESLVSRVGWTTSKKVQTNWAVITSQFRLSYERQNLKNNGTSVSLINAPFSTSGGNQSPGQDYMVAGAGLNFQFTDQFNLLFFYQGQFFRNNQEAHFGSVRFGYSF
jgi:outer membrane autotransporter protein